MHGISTLTVVEIAAGIIALLAILGIAHTLKGHHPVILLWRFTSGHHWAGIKLTDAGWFKRGTKKLVPHPVHRWHYLPRIHRAGIRTGITVIIVALAYGLILYRGYTILALIIGATLGAAGGFAYGIKRGRAWFNNRTTVTPLGEALAPLLAIPVVQAQQSISLPPSYLTTREGKIGQITLPAAFRADPGQRAAVEHLISTRLPIDTDFDWRVTKAPHHLAILAAPKPPNLVAFSRYHAEMKACKPGDVILGLDRKKEIRTGSFDTDDPHWGFSCASGKGKSTFLQITGAQILHQDPRNEFYGIDPKMNSLDPLIGIPGVYVARDPLNIGEMVALLTRFHADMMVEQAAVRDDPTLQFPFKLFALDELNTFSTMLRTWWRENKEPGDPAIPPVWSNIIAPCLWMGRRVNRHFIFVGQRLDDRATGGIGLRDSLGFRGLAGFRANQYRMLIGDGPVPKSQRQKGRWLYSDGSDDGEFWCQNLMADPQEIRDWAMAGRVNVPAQGQAAPQAASPGPVNGRVIP
jgi:hypothetical protein